MKKFLYTLAATLLFAASSSAQISQTFANLTINDTLKAPVTDSLILVKARLVPSLTYAYNLGSPSLIWRYGYFDFIIVNKVIYNTGFPDSCVVITGTDGQLNTDSVNFRWDPVSKRLLIGNITSSTSSGKLVVEDTASNFAFRPVFYGRNNSATGRTISLIESSNNRSVSMVVYGPSTSTIVANQPSANWTAVLSGGTPAGMLLGMTGQNGPVCLGYGALEPVVTVNSNLTAVIGRPSRGNSNTTMLSIVGRTANSSGYWLQSRDSSGQLLVAGQNNGFTSFGDSSASFTVDVEGTARIGQTPVSTSGGDSIAVKDSATGQIMAFPNNVNVSSAEGTLALGQRGHYIFTGTTSTWTLPAVATNTGATITIINKGSGTITLNSNAGGNDIWLAGASSNTIAVLTTVVTSLYCDGTQWNVLY